MAGLKEGEGERKGKVISLVVVLFGEEDGVWWSNEKGGDDEGDVCVVVAIVTGMITGIIVNDYRNNHRRRCPK